MNKDRIRNDNRKISYTFEEKKKEDFIREKKKKSIIEFSVYINIRKSLIINFGDKKYI